MPKPIEEVAVLGAGVMGGAIAAHLANAGLRVRLLDVASPGDAASPASPRSRNRRAEAGLDAARKARPAAFFSPRLDTLVTVGNLDDDLAAAAKADVIIEAVVERLDIKEQLFARLDALGGDAVVASNTSGLRLAEMLTGRSASFRRRFCVTHFFNPPRYLKLVEVVAGPDTAPETLATVRRLCGELLGKGVVLAKDTPNFIANRVGTFALMRTLHLAVERGYTVEEVDAIFGPALGRPKSAVFRTADLVGIDTLVHVAQNCHDNLTGDERRDVYALPEVLRRLVERKWLGEKTKQGFYKKESGEIRQLDLASFDYKPLAKPRFPSLGAARKAEDVAEKTRAVVWGDDRASELARAVMLETMAYAAARVPEIADEVVEVDRALRWGFGWELGPFEAWDALGMTRAAEAMRAAGIAVPAWVGERLAAGETSFYRRESPAAPRSYLRRAGGRAAEDEPPRALRLDAVRARGGEVVRNGSASLLDVGDGIFCLEFHAKMNAIDADIVAMTMTAVDRAEREGLGLVIGNDHPEAFCAGANIFALLVALGQNDWKTVADMASAFQGACQRTRYARVPVVAAPFGYTLGGGAEVVLGCQNVRAAAETYIGCVEVGVGIIPAGGGCMELAARASERAPDDPTFDMFSLVKTTYLNLAMAKVATSAEEGRDLGYLRPHHGVAMSRDTQLAEAKEVALGLARAGWRPPAPRRIRVIGESGAATIHSQLRNLASAHQISDHDRKVSGHLARAISGGSVPAGAVVTEQHILDLEREAFLSLCGEEKTRARMQHMLQTGKPLRN